MTKYILDTTFISPISKSKPKQIIVLCHGYGGDGKDRLYGGNGNDIFIGRPGDGSDGFLTTNVLYDFEDGVDKIRLEGGLNFSNLSITQGTKGSVTVGGYTFHYDFRNHTLVKAGSEYLFTITDTQHNTLTSEDFIY